MKLGIISGKGGVGGSTLALSLAKTLSEEEKVFLADGDWGRRSLDVYLGRRGGVYDFYNFLKGNKKGMEKIEEQLFYSPASLSKSFDDLSEKEVKVAFQKLRDWNSVIIDFSKRTGKEIGLFLPYADRMLIVAEPTVSSLIPAEGLYWELKRRRVKAEVVVTKVRDSRGLDDMIKNSLPRLEQYHIIRYYEHEYTENGELKSIDQQEVQRLLKELGEEEWENPTITPGFWDRLRGRK